MIGVHYFHSCFVFVDKSGKQYHNCFKVPHFTLFRSHFCLYLQNIFQCSYFPNTFSCLFEIVIYMHHSTFMQLNFSIALQFISICTSASISNHFLSYFSPALLFANKLAGQGNMLPAATLGAFTSPSEHNIDNLLSRTR